ncbi:ABC transporter permease subunit [Halorussus halobius]|uniref:ABC transporter permease subunit n=1 Tax=Halorussus halobius TaxID=1710537 RepID=UPI00109228D1|nr:ABC transporter permease subunit [Halorussus halobius]
MTARSLVIARKTLRDFSSLKLLLLYFVPYSVITILLSMGLTSSASDDLATLPLRTQEQLLIDSFSQLSFTWAAGIPMMVLIAVLAANGIAKTEQQGTLRILLSKPVRRRQVLLGKFGAIVAFAFLTTIAGIFICAVALYHFSGTVPLALGSSIFTLLPGTLLYAFFVCVLLATVGAIVATVTGGRLQTVLAMLLVPGLFFAFYFVRVVTGGSTVYETYKLHLLDVNYHLGNVFVFFHNVTGVTFSPLTQATLGPVTGVFDASGWGPDPLVGGLSGTVPVVGRVPMFVSVALLTTLAAVLLGLSMYHFNRKDIS